MIPQTTKQIAGFAKGILHGPGDITITSITTDSRKACEGSLFVCIKGERTDGHNYIDSAVNLGAAAILCEKEPESDVPFILVESAITAIGMIAANILSSARIPVVAISGSVGKTSTKEMIASVLCQKYRVLKTEANFNNELGLPLTIFNLEPFHEAAVLELGIDDFGQMHHLAAIARPDICVFTNIGDCHLEQLGDRNGVWRAKSEMIDHIKTGGSVILNGDDEILKQQTGINGITPVFYGLDGSCDVKATDIETTGLTSHFTITDANDSFPVTLSVPGVHNIRNALAAAAAGRRMGLTTDQIRAGIETYQTIDGRFKIIETGRFTLIDDCYNANPMSMKAALSSLSVMNGRRIAVLGDMGELGADTGRFHYEVGTAAAENRIDALFCAGEASSEIARGAKEHTSEMIIRYFPTRDEMLHDLLTFISDGDTILVKASHFMEFPKVVEALK